MPYIARGLDTYEEEHQELPKDITLRKQIIKDWYITRLIASIDKCVADKSRILSDTTTKIYREREYDTGFIVLDNLPLEEPFKEYGWLSDTRLTEYTYYNSTIPYIYHLKHLEYINGYKEENTLSFLELIYPTKMPTKDYFPFVEFDIATKIPLLLTEEEKQRYKENLDEFSSLTIDEDLWHYCILWIDKNRMFVSLEYTVYYFKQIGKNVHLFDLGFQ
ncbi:hypothetical protein XJ32_02645 [Helicobacter bilis]|uniref:Uncharacterized protein n=1 Tax=Helicobacter bilis TaxID=37372 RepID=A0A1Q2LFJ5_9HELI|nr:hypothetical protein [Helicobacter bilis]AQQ59190.1 hypothetical protein XJ32_02645 [Helicobacter bilis]